MKLERTSLLCLYSHRGDLFFRAGPSLKVLKSSGSARMETTEEVFMMRGFQPPPEDWDVERRVGRRSLVK